MTRLSSLALLSLAAIAMASPAVAKISVQGGENLCKSEITRQNAGATSVKADKDATRATGSTFTYLFKVKQADNTSAKLTCTVNRASDTITAITPVS
jgi:hypothetical protein